MIPIQQLISALENIQHSFENEGFEKFLDLNALGNDMTEVEWEAQAISLEQKIDHQLCNIQEAIYSLRNLNTFLS